MPIKKSEQAEKELKPYTVFIGGDDRTVMAFDEDDLKRKIEDIKSTIPH